MRQKADEELIKIIETAPDNATAKLAKELLEYRKYVAQRRQNAGIFWLTIVLTISAIVQATMAAVDVLAAREPNKPIISENCGQADGSEVRGNKEFATGKDRLP